MESRGLTEADALVWHGCWPFERIEGRAAVEVRVRAPLARAFDHLQRRTDLTIRGRWQNADWVATRGLLTGVFRNDWLGISATGRYAWLPWGRFDRLDGDAIVESYELFDFPALMIQAGNWPLAPSPGPTLPPQTVHVERSRDTHDADAADSLTLVENMIAGLMRYDGRTLASMNMRDYWTPDFRWHGPAPIGTFAGHADYERGHQQPFLTAFPDRVGGDHKCRIAQGPFVASTGWPSVRATHSGDGWLGLPATGRSVGMRVMDFWRRDGDRLAENWVMIDIPDLLRQLGMNVLPTPSPRP